MRGDDGGCFQNTNTLAARKIENGLRPAACANSPLQLQSILAQSGERSALCDEFLDLCTIHGENDPGEPRLARVFLARIEKGEVGTATEAERKPW